MTTATIPSRRDTAGAERISFGYRRPRNFRDPASAYRAGMFLRAALSGDERAKRYCKEHGVELRAAGPDLSIRTSQQAEGVNSQGGFLVPDELSESIIIIREKFGIIAADAGLAPMGRDVMSIPRRPMGSGLTTYFSNENTTGTATQLNLDAVELVSKKLLALVIYSSELAEDAVIEFADLMADEMGQAMAKVEDSCGFVGTGSSVYAGMTGASIKIIDGNHTAGVHQAASGHTAFSTLDGSDIAATMALLPAAYVPRARWYCSTAGFEYCFERLADVSGQSTWQNFEGISGPSYRGHLVRFAQSMCAVNTAQANVVAMLYGDLRAAVAIGRRRALTVKLSEARYLELDQLAVLGSQRFDIVCHGLGDTTNAGPLVALQFAAS